MFLYHIFNIIYLANYIPALFFIKKSFDYIFQFLIYLNNNNKL